MLSWISLVIPKDNRESSIEALQLATVYVMISISGFKPINQTKSNHEPTNQIHRIVPVCFPNLQTRLGNDIQRIAKTRQL